jgi:hypothetical protein
LRKNTKSTSKSVIIADEIFGTHRWRFMPNVYRFRNR